MRISTKGRYGVRVMMDLALHSSQNYVSLRDISPRQGITIRYLEVVIASLLKAKLVTSFRGKGGGYRLVRPPEEYTMLEILECMEGQLIPVQCMSDPINQCSMASACVTLPMWEGFYKVIRDYFTSITLLDLIQDQKEINFCAGI